MKRSRTKLLSYEVCRIRFRSVSLASWAISGILSKGSLNTIRRCKKPSFQRKVTNQPPKQHTSLSSSKLTNKLIFRLNHRLWTLMLCIQRIKMWLIFIDRLVVIHVWSTHTLLKRVNWFLRCQPSRAFQEGNE